MLDELGELMPAADPERCVRLQPVGSIKLRISETPTPNAAKETLENPAHLRENRPVTAGMDWVDGQQAAWLR